MSGGVVEEQYQDLKPWQKAENWVSIVILGFMVALPVISVVSRWVTGNAIASANVWVQTLNLWLTFAGGALAARASAHLALSTGNILKVDGTAKDILEGFTSAVATAITGMLAIASVLYIKSEMGSPTELPGGIPQWLTQVPMALGFLIMALVGWIFSLQKHLYSEGNLKPERIVGQTGQVYLRIPPNASGKGKITVSIQDRSEQFEASTPTDYDKELPTGCEVRITRMIAPGSFEVEAV